MLRRLVIDVDSTVKTAYGKQQGVSVGYNPHKRGKGVRLASLQFKKTFLG